MTFLAQAPRQTEAQFQASVVKLAELFGYRWYHTHRSDRSPSGFPDLVLVRPARRGLASRLIFAELKAQRGSVTPDQHTWLTTLMEAGAEVYLWRPADFRTIETTLRR
jgi:hypothetical protein